MATAITSSKGFNTKLAGVIRSASNLAANVQVLADYTITQASQGNLTEMAALILKTKAVKSINSTTLEKYLFASVLNVGWSKNIKTGEKTIRKIKDKDTTAKIKIVKNGVWTDYAPAKKEHAATSLSGITKESHDTKMAAFAARLVVTTKRDTLVAQQKLLKAQLALLDAKVADTAIIAVAA